MTDELVLYTHPMSRGRIARWMLEEVEAPYQTVLLDYGTTMKSPAYLAINPMGKVPALRHGDVVVTETAAICAHLADAFPGAGLAPAPGDRLRGTYYRWLFFAAGPVEAAVTNNALGLSVPPERAAMAGYGSFDAAMGGLEAALREGPYLLGDRFSAADVYLGSQIGFGLRFGSIDPRLPFIQYWERLSTRPALVRAQAIDDALAARGTEEPGDAGEA